MTPSSSFSPYLLHTHTQRLQKLTQTYTPTKARAYKHKNKASTKKLNFIFAVDLYARSFIDHFGLVCFIWKLGMDFDCVGNLKIDNKIEISFLKPSEKF